MTPVAELTARVDRPLAASPSTSSSLSGPERTGWRAELDLEFTARGERTIVSARHRRGPLLIQRPFHPEGGVCHTYLIHPPGGIVGGDELSLSLEVNADAHALVTTPGATRWYFSRGLDASLMQSARLHAGATLEWLPLESLYFDGAHARQRTRIELDRDARFCGWEVLGLGRPAAQEAFESGRLDLRFELLRDGEPLLLERQRSRSGRLPGLQGRAAYGTFLCTHSDSRVLDAVRATFESRIDALCGATLIGDLMIVRGLAPHCEPLMRVLMDAWSTARPLVLGRHACVPRIWRT